jgi:RNA polymerase sigma-70 factor (ECF subfamily)
LTDSSADIDAAAGAPGAAEEGERVDQRLVVAARDGDERALEQLLRRHEAPVLRLVRLLGVSPADREDVGQEIFVRVFRHLDGFKLGRSFRGWLYRITVNAVHDHRHRMTRRASRESPWNERMEDTPDAADGPPELVEAQESRRMLEEALDGLSARERAVFVLVEMQGLERRAAARALGITAITVRRHLSRARASLRRILEKKSRETS